MKKFMSFLVYTLVISMLMGTTVFAKAYNPEDYTSVNIESELLPSSEKRDHVFATPKERGNFFAGADILITNEGNGDIGAVATAYLDVAVDEVYITIYLDRWDEAADRWRQVTYYDAEFYAEDYPDGLFSPSVDIVFQDQTKGYSYRLRGVFAACLDGKFEGFSPTTAGIEIK